MTGEKPILEIEALCETCLERGRRRRADVVTEKLQMCRDCFEGKPTCGAEEIGGRGKRIGLRTEEQLDRIRASKRRWYQRNRDQQREYNRAYQRDRYRRLKSDREFAGAMMARNSESRMANSE